MPKRNLSFRTLIACTTLTCLFAASAMAEHSILLHLPLEGEDREITDIDDKKVGLHHPTSIADQDDPESRDPDRYREEGRYGGGIRYFADDRSYSLIDNGPDFDEPINRIALSMEVKFSESQNNRFASLISNKADSDYGGFALFLWGNEVRFRFSDGENQCDLRTKGSMLRDGEWHTLEAAFDGGRAAIWIDGQQRTIKDFDASVIAPPEHDLYLGGYPIDNKGRRQYAFDGWLDEVVIGELRNPTRKYVDEMYDVSRREDSAPVSYSVQPIDGNERFFGDEKVFHTFYGYPVPLTFLFNGRPEELEEQDIQDVSLVMYVPEDEGVDVVQVHQSNHNEQGGVIPTETDTVEEDGKAWTRYETSDVDLTESGWKKGAFVTWGFDAEAGVSQAKIRYGLQFDGKEQELTEATVRFLEPPEPVAESERGDFHNFGYFIMPAFAYPDQSLWEPTAELLKSVGLTGKGRFYSAANGKYRVDFDHFLRDNGFTLYEIGLWHGPKPHKMAVNPEKTTREYVERSGSVKSLKQGEPVLFDYEPWRITYKKESFKEDIREAFAKWAGLDETPDRSTIRSDYRREWTEFWLDVGNNVYGAMGKTVREHHPDPEAPRVSYTYFFNYDDEDRLYRRFWSVPKDPRLAEESDHVDVHLISLYHTNERELVDKTRVSRKHLERPIWGLSSVSRVNPVQSSFTSPEESLSPQRLEQKIVLCAALGMERHGIWPGRGWLDGRHLQAIGNASRVVWEYEDTFFTADRVHDNIRISPLDESAGRDDWAYTAHAVEDGTEALVSVFNFTGESMEFRITDDGAEEMVVEIEPHGYEIRRVNGHE